MSYPDTIQAELLEINGNTCGNLAGTLLFDPNSTPPEYTYSGEGDFAYARVWRVDLGGGAITWQMRLRYIISGNCFGYWLFQKTVNEDDPTGDYCRLVSGKVDCSKGKAGVTAV
jgi:hypothetical protein